MARPILLSSDFSPASGPAFRKALELAKSMRRPLLVVHVLSPVTLVTGDMYVAPNVWPMLEQSIEFVAKRGMARLIKRARAAGVRVSSLLLGGLTHEAIVRAARKHHAEMIVMGTHGRTGVKGVLLGSVASRVLTHAACPVMTVRAR